MRLLNEMRLDFPAIPENEAFARVVVSGFMLPLNPTLEQLADVKTAVSEAVTNAIIHGYAGRRGTVRLHGACTEDGVLYIDVIDRGRGIADVERARQPFYTTDQGAIEAGLIRMLYMCLPHFILIRLAKHSYPISRLVLIKTKYYLLRISENTL